jgi:guanylate kinase
MSKQQGKLFVIAAPSGAGKTTLVQALLRKNPELRFSISYTTRPQRRNEVDRVDYIFTSREDFAALLEQGEMLEHAEVFDNNYGTSRAQVAEHLAGGLNVILEIDWQGARQVRKSMPECVTIFILPPSLRELERRLRDRRTDAAEVIERRLRDAMSDMSHWDEFDHVVINDDLDVAVAHVEAVLAGDASSTATGNNQLRAAVERIVR